MLKVENIEVFNLEGSLRGMRNPLESWDKGDSFLPIVPSELIKWGDTIATTDNHKTSIVGPVDIGLAQKLIKAGPDHSKFMRQILVSMDITGPLYLLKEFDTYKIGTTANSESTMHKLATTPITPECFSFDKFNEEPQWCGMGLVSEPNIEFIQKEIARYCEFLRQKFLDTKDNQYWRALIQMLPSGWNQMRTWTANYAVLRNIYFSRKNHKLTEWHTFCEMIENLPYGKELITLENK